MQNLIFSCYQSSQVNVVFKNSTATDSIANSNIFETTNENTENENEETQTNDTIDETKLKLMDLANFIDYLRLVMMKINTLNKIKNVFKSIIAKLCI